MWQQGLEQQGVLRMQQQAAVLHAVLLSEAVDHFPGSAVT